jgi:RNA polymerase sigma factor (TIGR02999 family)
VWHQGRVAQHRIVWNNSSPRSEPKLPVTQEQITRALEALRDGDPIAEDALIPLVYDELRAMARSRLRREGGAATVGATELVHEVYLRLFGSTESTFDNRAHFFAAAAQAMRRVLVDRARGRNRARHGGGRERITFERVVDATPVDHDPDHDVLALDEALERLRQFDPRMAQVVLLRTFGGLSVADTARVLVLSERSVKREWACARAWLAERLAGFTEPRQRPNHGG